ncbi:MAG: GAF domain-containing protein [Lachnospiraceae bacterium]|nr:GAF domain-containing protein [Lachnospiraceae bacterium]
MEYDHELQAILDITIALSAESDHNKLFNMILTKSMEISNCDAGTLYLLKDNKLEFRIMKTLSMNYDRGSDGSPIDIPPVELREDHVCAYSVIHKESLNIEDVYDENDRFDFSGPRRYDSMTGFHTQSMITIPLINSEGAALGVLQLINAMDKDGKVIPFDKSLEQIIYAFASQAAITITNMRYQQELIDQMWSFAEALATAIDERTPYNTTHTRQVAKYCGMLADHFNKLYEEGQEKEYFSVNRKEQLVMGALLHDIGKLVTPLEVMNKATRLNGRENDIHTRLELIKLYAKVDLLEGRIDAGQYEEMIHKADTAYEMALNVNAKGFLDDETYESLKEMLSYEYVHEGKTYPFFTEEEKECLSVRKGTLTAEERKIMENHVVVTSKILDKVHFGSYFKNTPTWAGQHHECLDGSGYPNHKKGDELETDARMIAVADICDALLATDRPYKKPIPKDKAFDIMRDMADNGKIDKKIVGYMAECLDA